MMLEIHNVFLILRHRSPSVARTTTDDAGPAFAFENSIRDRPGATQPVTRSIGLCAAAASMRRLDGLPARQTDTIILCDGLGDPRPLLLEDFLTVWVHSASDQHCFHKCSRCHERNGSSINDTMGSGFSALFSMASSPGSAYASATLVSAGPVMLDALDRMIGPMDGCRWHAPGRWRPSSRQDAGRRRGIDRPRGSAG